MPAQLLPILTKLLSGGAGAAGAAGTTSTAAGGASAAGSLSGGAGAAGAAGAGTAAAGAIPSQSMQYEDLRSVLDKVRGAGNTMQSFSGPGGQNDKGGLNPLIAGTWGAANPGQKSVMADAGQMKGEMASAAKSMFFGGPVGWVEGWLKVQKIMVTLPFRLEKWGEALAESQRKLMQFNGQIAKAFVESERRGILRDVGSASRTSESTEQLVEAVDELRDELQPIRDIVTNASNKIVGMLARFMTLYMRNMHLLNPPLYHIQKTLEEILNSDSTPGDPGRFVQFQQDLELLGRRRDAFRERRIRAERGG